MIPSPTLHEHIRQYRNPQMGRLTYQGGCLAARRTWLISVNCVLALGAFLLAVSAISPAVGGSFTLICIGGMIVPLMIMIPPFVVLQSINLTVDDVNAQQFDVLRTTTLSNWELGGAYVLATIWRTRTFLTVLIGAWLAIIITAWIALVLLSGLGDQVFQRQNYEAIRIAWLISTVGIQQIGTILALTVIPVALIMRFGKVIPYTLIMPFVALISVVIPSILALVLLKVNDSPITVDDVIISILLGGWAWIALGLGLIALRRWVRHGG